jgi:5-formyltetrahydrofolate cyclo-ligase
MAPDVPAPEVLAPEALGLLLVPALAIDQAGIRLGSGGGWYDRLRADPAWRAVPALAVLPAACVCAQLPRDKWDVPFAGWLDERGVTWLEKGG